MIEPVQRNDAEMRGEIWRWAGRGTGLAIGVVAVTTITFIALHALHSLLLVFVALLLAVGLEPVTGWLRARFGLGRGMNVLIAYAGFFAGVVILGVLIVPATIDQLIEFAAKLPQLLATTREWAATLRPRALASTATGIVDAVARATRVTADGATDPNALVGAGLTVADAVISVITVLTLVFFWLTGHQRMQRFTLALLPADRRGGVREGWNEVESRLGLWVRGQLILMGSIFAMTTVAYVILGLENALLLGVIAGLAEIVPIVGPALGAIPALLVASVSGRPETVLLVAAVYVVIQVLEGNVLVPLVMRRTIGVPPFLVVVSLLVGAAVGGIVGAFLAVPLAAAVVVILERTQARETTVGLDGNSPAASPETEELVTEQPALA